MKHLIVTMTLVILMKAIIRFFNKITWTSSWEAGASILNINYYTIKGFPALEMIVLAC